MLVTDIQLQLTILVILHCILYQSLTTVQKRKLRDKEILKNPQLCVGKTEQT